MKTLSGMMCTVFLVCTIASAGGLVTGGSRHPFVPGDTVLFETDFHQCPVGEAPQGFDAIQGIAECVTYDNHVWVGANGSSDLKLYKKLDLGTEDFSIQFTFLTYGKDGDVAFQLFKDSPEGWHAKTAGQRVHFKYCCNRYLEGYLEHTGKILDTDHENQKRFTVAVQVRRGQFRVFLNGKRLSAVPFTLDKGERLSGFAIMRKGRNSYNLLFTDVRAATYSEAEAKPTPEKLGIEVETTANGLKLTVPERVLFDFNMFTLKPNAKKALDVVAGIIRKHPGTHILVTGYTDSIGSKAYNLKLSLQRAQSVADFLMYCEKLDPGTFTIEGKGESHPIADNSTEAGRAKNRRVEIKLLKSPAHPRNGGERKQK